MNTATIDNQPTTNSRRTPSAKQELIAANIKLLIEQLEAGHSDALTNYLTAMSRSHNYSLGTCWRLHGRCPPLPALQDSGRGGTLDAASMPERRASSRYDV